MNLPPQEAPEKVIYRSLLDVMIRIGLIGIMAVLCYQVFHPFMGIILWALILAVTLYPPQQMLAARMRGKQGWAATVLVLLCLLLLVAPASLIVTSLAESIQRVVVGFQNHTLAIPEPPASLATWPLIGAKLHEAWHLAATDFFSLAQRLQPHLSKLALPLLGIIASFGGGMFKFLFALIIAGILMAYGETGAKTAQAIAIRIAGEHRGHELARLSTATIRAVAQGVIGIAFIQALLLGLGFVAIGVPGAGILAILVLLLGIMQLPATIITVPVIIYVFTTDISTAGAIAFTVWTVLGGLSDNVLKPLLLGRGVDAPMPVILLGALGGMITGGIIGMFVGAVVLALGQQLFMSWVHQAEPPGSF